MDLNKYLHLDNLPPADKAAFVASFMQLVYARLADILGDRLSDEQANQLEQLTAAGDEQATMAWLRSNVHEFDKLLDQVMTEESQEIHAKLQALIDTQGS